MDAAELQLRRIHRDHAGRADHQNLCGWFLLPRTVAQGASYILHGTEGTARRARKCAPCRLAVGHATPGSSRVRRARGKADGRAGGRARGKLAEKSVAIPGVAPRPEVAVGTDGKRAMSRRDSHVCMLISGAGRGCARRCTAHRARTCHACCVAPLFSPELLPPPPGLWSILRMPGSAGPSCACLFGADRECRDMADRELLATLCLSSPRRSIQMNHSLPETCQQKPNALGALGSLGPAKEY